MNDLKVKLKWIPDTPDFRDYKFVRAAKVKLPAKTDLRLLMPPIYDQGDLGSCVSHAIAAMFEFVLKKTNKQAMLPSRLFMYYNQRVILGTVNYDSGATIRDGMKSLYKQGACPEVTWPYLIERFTTRPNSTAFTQALNHQSVNYLRLNPTLANLKSCLSEGYPFVFGFAVYQSFLNITKNNPNLSMPKPRESFLGGHAVTVVGYNDATNRFTVRNSWGTSWGDGGYYTMPYEYLINTNLCDDFWTLRKVE